MTEKKELIISLHEIRKLLGKMEKLSIEKDRPNLCVFIDLQVGSSGNVFGLANIDKVK